jgi:hypothetical protein
MSEQSPLHRRCPLSPDHYRPICRSCYIKLDRNEAKRNARHSYYLAASHPVTSTNKPQYPVMQQSPP